LCNGNHQVLGKNIFLEDIVKLTLHSLMNFNEEYPKYEFYFKFYRDKIVNGTFSCTHLQFEQEVYYSEDCILNERKRLILLEIESDM